MGTSLVRSFTSSIYFPIAHRFAQWHFLSLFGICKLILQINAKSCSKFTKKILTLLRWLIEDDSGKIVLVAMYVRDPTKEYQLQTLACRQHTPEHNFFPSKQTEQLWKMEDFLLERNGCRKCPSMVCFNAVFGCTGVTRGCQTQWQSENTKEQRPHALIGGIPANDETPVIVLAICWTKKINCLSLESAEYLLNNIASCYFCLYMKLEVLNCSLK